MAQNGTSKSSFSSGRRWLGALNMTLMTLAALALLVMANYLSVDHFLRIQLSQAAGFKLSRQTLAVLKSLTNNVQVTVFFQANNGDNEQIYGLTRGLLNEYQNANPAHVHLNFLDYTRFPEPAKELLARCGMTVAEEKDFVLFENTNSGHRKIVYASGMAQYDFSELMARRSKYVRRSAFLGEPLFTSAIYAVSYPQALKTYFLYGHGENNPGDPTGKSQDDVGNTGYSKLAGILTKEIDCGWDLLSLRGTNDVPRDCQLLVVAGPRQGEFLPEEVNKIAAYLKNGGRLLALLGQPCGLEAVLKQWGLEFGAGRAWETDPEFTHGTGLFLTARLFPPHPVVDALAKDQRPIIMEPTRPLILLDTNGIPGAPAVTPLAATTTNNGVNTEHRKGEYYLLAAIEQGDIKGVDTPRGEGTRIVVAGDSDFLDDQILGAYPPNHDFAFLALSWLLHRPSLMLEGLVPQPIQEYRLYLTTAQSMVVRWLFLAGLPAGILAVGGLVWLRRRH